MRLDMALVAVSVALPEQAVVVTLHIRDWSGCAEPPVRTALGLALAVHGVTDDAVGQLLSEEVDLDARRAAHIRRRTPGGPWLSGLDQGPNVYSPVLGAIQLAAGLRAGEDAECDAFSLADPFPQRHGHEVVLPPVFEDGFEGAGAKDGGVAQARCEGAQAAALLGGGHDRGADLALGAGAFEGLIAIESGHREVKATTA
jgi:hypothetical protein